MGEDQTRGGQDKTQGGPDLTIRDGMRASEVEALLQKERDRADMQRKAEIEKARAEAAEAAKAEAAEEARRAQMDELDKALEDAKKAAARADEAEARLADVEARAARSSFIAEHGGGLDKAWRAYLDMELANSNPDDWQKTLEQVRAEHAEATGGARKPGDMGTGGRPAPQAQADTINQKIRRAAGR